MGWFPDLASDGRHTRLRQAVQACRALIGRHTPLLPRRPRDPAASANLSIGITRPPMPDSAQQTSSPWFELYGWFTGTGADQLLEPSDGCLLGLVDLPKDAAHGGQDRGDLLGSERRLGGVAVAQRPEAPRRGGAVGPAGITLRDSGRHGRGELAGLGARRDIGRHGRLSQAVPELADL